MKREGRLDGGLFLRREQAESAFLEREVQQAEKQSLWVLTQAAVWQFCQESVTFSSVCIFSSVK